MNWNEFQEQWINLRVKLKARWNKLSDSDIQVINGDQIQLICLLQSKYWISKQEAENQIEDFLNSLG